MSDSLYSKLKDQLPRIIRPLKNIKKEIDILGSGITISWAPGGMDHAMLT